MPGLRTQAITAAAGLVGLPWRGARSRSKPLSPDDRSLKRVLVIKPCCMGDVLMSTAAVAELREALPGSEISFLVGNYSQPAVENNPRLNSLLPTKEGVLDYVQGYLSTAARIRKGRFGAALVLDRSPMLNMLPLVARVPVRAGLDSGNRGIGLTHPVSCPENASRHEVEWYLDVVRALGLPASEKARLEFYPAESDKQEAGRLLSETSEEGEEGYVAIHVGGGANPGMKLPSKRWRPERWARIADWLAETYGSTILLLGGPGKEDRQAAEEVKSSLFPATLPYVTDLVGKTGWGTMGALIARCSLFLGNDTGAMHLATAVGTPVVAVFGPSDAARYGPWDPSGRSVVVAPATRAKSGAEALRAASRSKNSYHDLVSAEQVWKAVERTYTRAVAVAGRPR
ncbi:MAG TPA: glycosyltransferase family 9 protein [Chloroflexia bacterium]|nr:glycosyltransferase family 9 protein [Chloroflexia bacterium]